MKLKILKYNKDKARWLFSLLKFSELFAVFLLIFGFHGLGSIVYNNFPKLYFEMVGSEIANFGNFWWCGFGTFCLIILNLLIVSLIVWVIYSIFKVWFKANWRWAQTLAEDEETKKERLSEQKKLKEIKKIEKLEKERKKFGYCVGDKVLFKKASSYPDGFYAPDGFYNKEATISAIFENGKFDLKECGDRFSSKCEIKKIVKKIDVPKKPKLNLTRQKEVEGWKK